MSESGQANQRSPVSDRQLAVLEESSLMGDVEELILLMSRFLASLSKLRIFQEANLPFSDWAALVVLRQKDALSVSELAERLGVTRMRARQICASLEKARLIKRLVVASNEESSDIAITELGKTTLENFGNQLDSFLAAALADSEQLPQRALSNVRDMARRLRRAARSRLMGKKGKKQQQSKMKQ